MKDIRTKHKSR